jgi:hypothetical protein
MYLRVGIGVDVNGVMSTLTALLKVQRQANCGKPGKDGVTVLNYSLR